MPGFNFLFEAFILLMGLAMAEVLRGFARVLKLRVRRRAGIDASEAIRIGWLTPLLGLFVIVDQATFFLHMYGLREILPFNGGTVLGILFAIGWYYLIASMTFPDKPADWPHFDEWFWLQKRFVVGGILGVNAISIAASIAFTTVETQQAIAAAMTPKLIMANTIILFVLPAMFWLAFSKSKRVCIGLMAFCVIATLFYGGLVIDTTQPG